MVLTDSESLNAQQRATRTRLLELPETRRGSKRFKFIKLRDETTKQPLKAQAAELMRAWLADSSN